MSKKLRMTSIATFAIPYLQCIDDEGRPNEEGMPEPYEDHFPPVADLLRSMVRARKLSAKAVVLQRTGRLGTFAASDGHEALEAAIAVVLREEDIFCPGYRDMQAQIDRGVAPGQSLAFWGGSLHGCAGGEGGAAHDFPATVPVGSQAQFAPGAAFALARRGVPGVALCIVGDGATSEGYVLEALNLSGAMKLGTVWVVNNNQWAISMPRSEQTAAETLAQKAVAFGMPGIQVDGNDVFAVIYALKLAHQRALAGDGPSLIEAVTYRMSDHTTSDSAKRYRDGSEVEEWKAKDPIARLKAFGLTTGRLSPKTIAQIDEDATAWVESVSADYLAREPDDPGLVFDNLFAHPPAHLERELAEMRRYSGEIS